MISIIISSAKKELLDQVKLNIAATVGVEHQIIAFDNSDGKKGICEIYNLGIAEAKFDLLCFMHEDVAMITADWGLIVQKIFDEHPDVGLIGVAGSSYQPLSPSGWNGYGSDNYYLNLLQSFKFSDQERTLRYRNPNNEKLVPVACIDGVWFCTTKSLAVKYRFDENFKGFHVYDLDFSLAVGQEKTVAVTFEVLLHHFSEGQYNVPWLESTIQLYQKWFNALPVEVEPLTKKKRVFIERKTFKHFIKLMANSHLSLSIANRFLWKDNRFIKLNFGLFLKLQFYILIAMIKRLLGINVK
jgi:hypothetical protein